MAKNEMTIYRGTSKTMVITVTNSAKQAVDFAAGDSVVLSVKATLDAASKVLEKVVTTFDGNKVSVTLEPADTQNLSVAQSYTYDVQVKRADGSVEMLIEPSKLTFSQSVADGDLGA